MRIPFSPLSATLAVLALGSCDDASPGDGSKGTDSNECARDSSDAGPPEVIITDEVPCYEPGDATDGKAFACDWVTIEGGRYMMGTPDGMAPEPREYPQHPVDVPTFRLWRTENTVAEYLACLDDGWCIPTVVDGYFCNADYPVERNSHPMNCIDWYQARDFCHWLGGRLPTEAEWEFAARSRGQDILYPWGNEDPSCELAIIDMEYLEEGGQNPGGCDGIDTTQPVCSKPMGNSAEGLCDFSGNVYEWVEDYYHWSYAYEEEGVTYTAPADGSAWIVPPNPDGHRIMKGGGIGSPEVNRPAARQFHPGSFAYGGLGVRCARDM